MAVNGDEEPLIELEGTGELLHQLPHTLKELIDDWRYLLGISNQVVAPGEGGVGMVRSKQKPIQITVALEVNVRVKPVSELVPKRDPVSLDENLS